jgi:hypothetical protein
VQIAFFLPFRRHHDRIIVAAKLLSDDELASPGAEIRLPFSCLLGATSCGSARILNERTLLRSRYDSGGYGMASARMCGMTP